MLGKPMFQSNPVNRQVTEFYQRKNSMMQNLRGSIGGGEDIIDDDPFSRHTQNVYVHRNIDNVNLNPPINQARRYTEMGGTNIVRICLTGGPCAGKTTAIADIKQDLT